MVRSELGVRLLTGLFQQAAARRGIRRMGMRICEGRIASPSVGAEGATGSGLSRRGCSPAHKLHGQRNESLEETLVVTCSLYTRRISPA